MNLAVIGMSILITVLISSGRTANVVILGYAIILVICASVPLIFGDPSGLLVSVLCLACIYELIGIRNLFYGKSRFISASGFLSGGVFLYFVVRSIGTNHWHGPLINNDEASALLPMAVLAAGILLLGALRRDTRT